MYIPKYYRVEDRGALVGFMRANSFATLVTAHTDGPLATHLPFVVDDTGEALVLRSHMARANPHWKSFDAGGAPSLVVFQRPHAYISPDLYDSQVNVPTWNYAVAHAYGVPRVLDGEAAEQVVLAMIAAFQTAYRQQYDGLPPDFKRNMLKGIVAFEIPIARLEGKHKLSQNKTPAEQERIAAALLSAEDPVAAEVGRLMAERLARS